MERPGACGAGRLIPRTLHLRGPSPIEPPRPHRGRRLPRHGARPTSPVRGRGAGPAPRELPGHPRGTRGQPESRSPIPELRAFGLAGFRASRHALPHERAVDRSEPDGTLTRDKGSRPGRVHRVDSQEVRSYDLSAATRSPRAGPVVLRHGACPSDETRGAGPWWASPARSLQGTERERDAFSGVSEPRAPGHR